MSMIRAIVKRPDEEYGHVTNVSNKMTIEARQRIHAIALTKIHAAARFVTVSIIIETTLIAWLIGGN